MRRSTRARRGMTLVEVMVALVVLVVMASVIMESIRSSIEFHRLLAARDETVRTARSALAKLSHDLQLAYLSPNRNAVNTYQTVFVADDSEPAQLYFASLAHQRLYLDSRECDQTEITVWGDVRRTRSGVATCFTTARRRASTTCPTSRG
jgi:general secretion pathway protein J